MAMATNLKVQTRTTKTSTIKVITTNTIINKVTIKTTISTKDKTATTMSLGITMPTLVTHTNKMVDTMKDTSRAIKTSTTMSSTTIKGRQLLASTPNMVKVAMEQSQSVVATIPRKTLRLSATSP